MVVVVVVVFMSMRGTSVKVKYKNVMKFYLEIVLIYITLI